MTDEDKLYEDELRNKAYSDYERLDMAIKALEQQPCEEDFIQHKKEVLERIARREREIDKYIKELEELEQQPFINKPCVSEGVCREDKIQVLDKMKAEIKEWYWKADKQALAKDPCVVDAMVDLFIRTIDKYEAESEEK